MRLRRSELSTPGSNPRMIEKAAASDADLVFLDLEDSVAPAMKDSARRQVAEALCALDWGRKSRAVRINNVESPWCYQDIVEVVETARDNLDLLIIPKVKTVRHVDFVDLLLTQLEAKLKLTHRIGLEVLIEEVEALVNVDQIARATPRLEALIFGPGDFSASQGVRLSAIGVTTAAYPGDIWHYARSRIVVAARAAGIEAVDGPFADFNDPEGYRLEATRSSILGFVGKWAIHPSQIAIANEVYSPTAQEVAEARKVLNALKEAEAKGLGAVTLDGRMIDVATARIMEAVVKKADLIGL